MLQPARPPRRGPRYCTSDLIAQVSLLDPSPRGRAEERDKEDAMNMRVRQLRAPVLSTFLISVAVQFVALSVPQLPPWVFFTRNGVSIVLAPLWMLAVPFIGALGA